MNVIRHPIVASALLFVAVAASFGLSRSGADPMSAAATAFLDSLDAAQRERCVHAFEDAERRNWQPAPFGTAGVRLDDMNETQREAALGLLRAALSTKGLATVDGVLTLEKILVRLGEERGQRGSMLAVDRYFVTVYGDPSRTEPWGWRIEGHHLSMTFTCANDRWVAHGPIFVGSQPARVRGGEHDGMRLLGSKDDGVRALLAKLDDRQRGVAVLGDRLPGNILLLPGRDDGFEESQGLRAADMTAEQKVMLREAVFEWASLLRDDLAEKEYRRIESSFDAIQFAWIGGTDPDEPHYWRFVGPHFAIEYVAPQQDPDHVHAIWRDLENDFGGDLLRKHLEEHHGAK